MLKTMIPALEQYEITRATLEDAPDVIDLLKETARWVKDKHVRQWSDLLDGKLDPLIISTIVQHETFMIKKDGQLVATFSLNEVQIDLDKRVWGELDDGAVYLHKLAVSPRHIGSGLGKEIIAYAAQYVKEKGKPYLRLDCVGDNEKLVNFYTKCGFTKVGMGYGHTKFEMKLN